MSDWRDDLPPIPADRIRSDAIREGHRRLQQRRERRLAALYGGIGTVAVVLVVVAALAIRPGADGDDDAASSATDTPTDTEASGTEAPAGTEPAAATTGAPEATTADTEAASATTEGAAASETTMVPHTTIGGPIAVLPPSEDVLTDLATIWEQPDAGLTCGPSALTVTYIPRTLPMDNPIVHWETAGVVGESPMTVADQVATATVGPFAADTLATGVVHEVLVWVTVGSEVSAPAAFRAPTVVLRDCSP